MPAQHACFKFRDDAAHANEQTVLFKARQLWHTYGLPSFSSHGCAVLQNLSRWAFSLAASGLIGYSSPTARQQHNWDRIWAIILPLMPWPVLPSSKIRSKKLLISFFSRRRQFIFTSLDECIPSWPLGAPPHCVFNALIAMSDVNKPSRNLLLNLALNKDGLELPQRHLDWIAWKPNFNRKLGMLLSYTFYQDSLLILWKPS